MRTLTRRIAGAQYVAMRTPLALIEGALTHVPGTAPVRRVVHGGVSRLNGLAAAVLAPPQQSSPSRNTTSAPAQQPTPPAGAEELAEEQEQIVEAILSEEEERKHVGELAEADEQTKLDLAELRAKHKVLELEEERRLREEHNA